MKKILVRAALVLTALMLFIALILAIEYFGGQPMGFFTGKRPSSLGFTGGKFTPPSWKPNTVSSTVEKTDTTHFIAPLNIAGDTAAAWKKLLAQVKGTPRVTVITEQPNYLYTEFKTVGLGFIDDVEFALDAPANVIHVRSGSRLGVRDFGVNRARLEAIRTAMETK